MAKRLFGLFEDVEESKSETKATPQQQTSTKPSDSNLISRAVPQGEIDGEIENRLNSVIAESNVEGYDYFEFRESLNNMKAVIPGEPERFKAAHAAVASLVKPEKLIETANFYISKLNEKKVEFDQYSESRIAQEVTAREDKAKSIDAEISKKQDTITKLNQEISEFQQRKGILLSESIAEKAKVDKVKMNFNLTFKIIVDSITQDIQKIKTYLIK